MQAPVVTAVDDDVEDDEQDPFVDAEEQFVNSLDFQDDFDDAELNDVKEKTEQE
jgi:hypothetical protein